MRSYNQQQDGSGNGPSSDLINRLLKRLDELELYSSQTVTVEKMTRGQRLHTKGGFFGLQLPQMFLIKDDLGSCFKCWGWDGTNEIGPAVYVAKRPEIRMVNESDIMGDVTYAYTYDLGAADTSSFAGDIPEATQLTANGDGSGGAGSKMNTDQSQLHYLKRTTTPDDGSAAITEHITPPPHFNSLIYAVPIATETLDGQQCSWMDTSGREWADDLGT